MAQGMYAPGAGGPPPGGAPGMPPGEFMGPPPDNQPLQEGDDAGLRAELEGLLASWEEKTPNTVAGQYFQDLARVLSKYA